MTMHNSTEHDMNAHSDHQGRCGPRDRSSDATAAGGETPGAAGALVERLHQAQARCERLAAGLASAAAEHAHARRRAEIDPCLAEAAAVEKLASEILPIRDVLETALQIRTADAAAFREGMTLALRKLTAALAKHGLIEIAPAAGDPFDPLLHHADGVPTQDSDACKVMEMHEKGYLLNGRTLRAARVSI